MRKDYDILSMKPSVSVIIPNYNHARYLRERIDSVLNQRFQDYEIILLDDNSTDESPTIIQSYASAPHVTHIEINEQNSGSPFAQWDKGISLAAGEFIWIAESDDVADTLDYAAVYRLVNSEMAVPSQLLEHVAGRIVQALLRQFPVISSIDLWLTKLTPPMGADCDGAGVELHWGR